MKTTHGLAKVLISTSLFFAGFSVANAQDVTPAFEEAYDSYLQVSSEAGGSAKSVTKQWQTLVEQDQDDPFALVMLGSSRTLMGRDALMPWSKLKHTETGLEDMALAQRLLDDTHDREYFRGMSVAHHVKTTAAIVYSQVPDFFGRHEDGFYLFDDVLNDPSFHQLPGAAKTYVYYYGIVAANQIGKNTEAEQWLTELEALKIDDDYTAAALELE